VIRYRVDVVLSLNASENGEPDQPIDACLIPSQLLATELLRRPLEYAENTSVKRLNALPTAGPFLAH
jgi:hypothetical protein